MSLQIGLGTISGQVPAERSAEVAETYADILALAGVAEAVGFDSLWVSSHHGAANAHLPAPLVMLAAIAAVTRRIRLGTAIVLAPFQDPLRFAEDCAVLDQLARGRLTVGLGVGWRQQEFDAFGLPIGERVGRTVELARICRLAWERERFSYEGRFHAYREVAVTPKPFGRLPLWLGGGAQPAVERAGRLADGFIGSPRRQVEDVVGLVETLDRAAQAAGRDPDRLALAFQFDCWVSPDGELPTSVQRAMWRQFGNSLRWHAGAGDGEPGGLPPLDEARIRERTIAGTPAEILAQLDPWLGRLGGRDLHLLFRLHYPGLERDQAEGAVRLFGAEVIPALKRRAAA